MTKIQMYPAIFLTMLPIMVTALPITSLTRDNVAKPRKNKLVQYFKRFGHFDKPDARKLSPKANMTAVKPTETSYTIDEIPPGIKSLQKTPGLTRRLKKDILKLMKDPRKSATQNKLFQLKIHQRLRRYVIYHLSKHGGFQIHKWNKKVITWQVNKEWKGNFPKRDQEEIFDQAFKIWEYETPLRFQKIAPSSGTWPDIDIEFHTGAHGDSNPFDGPKNILAHAFLPNSGKSGDIHIDASENWNKKFLRDVAVHEIGHSLGLGHSSSSSSVMGTTYKKNIVSLLQDDKDAMEKLYGLCQTKVDAVIYLESYDVYFIRKDLVWKYDSTGKKVYAGYPKKINDEFPSISGPKIPSYLDCASRYINHTNHKNFYFVKGNQVYIYDEITKKTTVKTTSQFWPSHGRTPGIPTKVPVALSITGYPVGTWIIKDNYVWKYEDYNKREIVKGYPVEISKSIFNGLPKDVDDGYYDEKESIFYFFKDTKYYEIPFTYSGGKNVVKSDYIHKKWSKICSAKY